MTELFVRKGTRATSVDDIAKAAGTSRATFYAHFTDKQDVIREFARSMWETAFAVYTRFGTLKEWNHATIGGWMKELFDAWDQNADTTYIVIQEMPSELRADFQFIRRLRTSSDQMQRAGWRAVITVFVTGICGLIWLGIQTKFGK